MQVLEAGPARPTIVVVESDAALAGALKFALELDGYGVAAFGSGAEVLAERDLPSEGCLVVEFNLPGMNGIDLVSALRNRAVNLPAVLLAGRTSPSLRLKAAAAGLRVVEKPLLGNNLADTIRSALAGEPPPRLNSPGSNQDRR
jgi:FixJ family two-component response regulator